MDLHDLMASPTNSDLPVYLKYVVKGSGAATYLEISPNFGLREHYIPVAHESLNLVVSDLCLNIIQFYVKIIFFELLE